MTTRATDWRVWRGLVTGDQVVVHNLVVAASTMGAGILGVAFQALVAHQLRPVDYGAVFAVITLITFIGLPTGALTLLMARESSRDSARSDHVASSALLTRGNRNLVLGGLLLAALLAISSPLFASFLDVPIALLLAASGGLPFALASPLLMGEFQGQQRFLALALFSITQAALKLLAGVGLGVLFGPVGIIAGISLASATTYLVARWVLRRRLSLKVEAAWWRGAKDYLGVVVPSTLALAVLLSTDVLLVKHFFPPRVAGDYAAIAALGRAIYWGASGVAIVLFPKVVFQGARGQHGTRVVIASLILVGLGGLFGFGVLTVASKSLLTLFAGPTYVEAAGLMPLYALGMTLLGGVAVLIATHQSRGKYGFLLILVPLTLVEPALIAMFHQSLTQVVLVVDASMGLVLAGLAALFLLQIRTVMGDTAGDRPRTRSGDTAKDEIGNVTADWAWVDSV